MENYSVKKALGQGTWGVVHMAEQKGTGRIVAIKKIKSERPEEGVNFTAVREVKLLREFKHENIIELVDCFTTPDQAVCLVYECAQTDLEKILANRAIPISMADTKRHLLSLLRAVAACHERSQAGEYAFSRRRDDESGRFRSRPHVWYPQNTIVTSSHNTLVQATRTLVGGFGILIRSRYVECRVYLCRTLAEAPLSSRKEYRHFTARYNLSSLWYTERVRTIL
jgi:serine/threonine protein kinase